MGVVYLDGYGIAGGGGSQTTVVANYSALPPANTVTGKFFWASNTEFFFTYPFIRYSGQYYSNGVFWEYQGTAMRATLSQVNTGTDNTMFITPSTFTNSNKIVNSFQKNVDDSDDITEGSVNRFDVNFIFTQGVAATLWSVAHNLNKRPSVSVVDSMETQVEGIVTYIDDNNLTIEFNATMSGKAYLN